MRSQSPFQMTKRRFEVLYAIAFTGDLVTEQNRYMTFYKQGSVHPEHRIHGVNVDVICSLLRRERLIRNCRVGMGVEPFRPIITLKGIDVLLQRRILDNQKPFNTRCGFDRTITPTVRNHL